MALESTGWKNKNGTGDRSCKCGSWKNHWMMVSSKLWPRKCQVRGCSNGATLGAHVYNSEPCGEWIIPMCESCNKRTDEFAVEYSTDFVRANEHYCP